MSNEEEGRPPEQESTPKPDQEPAAQQQPEPAREEESAAPEQITINKPNLERITSDAIRVISNPIGFYQQMPKSGGLIDPLIFMIALSVIAGVLSAGLSIFGFGMAGAMAAGLIAIIMIPIFVVIFGFVGAAIAYVIWKVMGSDEDFETAFRCVAYTAAISPIVSVLGVVPYVGSLVSALWPMALLAIASIHVHGRSVQASWAVFGILGLILAMMNVSGERASRHMSDSLEELQQILEEQRR